MVSFSVLIIVFSIILFIIAAAFLGDEEEELRAFAQKRMLLSNLKHFPFSDVLFRETMECAICLEKFNGTEDIVQLKCSKYHIYHLSCMRKLLDVDDGPLELDEPKCPLCR